MGVMLCTMISFTSCSAVQSVKATEKVKTTPKREKVVKIYPDVVKRIMHVKNLESKELDFFVFDTGGAIVLHYKMSEGEHVKISGLDRGNYVYQVFEGDAMTESGKMNIR